MKKLILLFVLTVFAVLSFAQTGEIYEREVGTQHGKYPMTLDGLQRAIASLDSGVVYINYPGLWDTTGLGAIPSTIKLNGWLFGEMIFGHDLKIVGALNYSKPFQLWRDSIDTDGPYMSFTTLQEAIDSATWGNDDRIVVKSGYYTLSVAIQTKHRVHIDCEPGVVFRADSSIRIIFNSSDNNSRGETWRLSGNPTLILDQPNFSKYEYFYWNLGDPQSEGNYLYGGTVEEYKFIYETMIRIRARADTLYIFELGHDFGEWIENNLADFKDIYQNSSYHSVNYVITKYNPGEYSVETQHYKDRSTDLLEVSTSYYHAKPGADFNWEDNYYDVNSPHKFWWADSSMNLYLDFYLIADGQIGVYITDESGTARDINPSTNLGYYRARFEIIPSFHWTD